jgi:hypothetical protein
MFIPLILTKRNWLLSFALYVNTKSSTHKFMGKLPKCHAKVGI